MPGEFREAVNGQQAAIRARIRLDAGVRPRVETAMVEKQFSHRAVLFRRPPGVQRIAGIQPPIPEHQIVPAVAIEIPDREALPPAGEGTEFKILRLPESHRRIPRVQQGASEAKDGGRSPFAHSDEFRVGIGIQVGKCGGGHQPEIGHGEGTKGMAVKLKQLAG